MLAHSGAVPGVSCRWSEASVKRATSQQLKRVRGSRAALRAPVINYLRVAGGEEYEKGCSFIRSSEMWFWRKKGATCSQGIDLGPSSR